MVTASTLSCRERVQETDGLMTLKKTLLAGLALVIAGIVSASPARADDFDQKTILTFSQPFEIGKYRLPAGTYTFQLADSLSDRHIVRISNHDGTEHIGFVMAIANYRLEPTEKTVITFNEVPAGSPEAVRAWFYPGRSAGHEFVYPKGRALELAAASRVAVPALAVDSDDPDLATAPIVAVTPDRKEVPVASVIQTTPMPGQTPLPERTMASPTPGQTPRPERTMASAAPRSSEQLPQTASPLSLIALLGLASLGVAGTLMSGRRYLGRRRRVLTP